MANWTVAPALNTLLRQLNEAFPRRSKVSDGSIGDTRHQANKSDHNPNSRNMVTARDFTHDPKTGIDCNWLAATLVKNKDPRVKYIIWNKKICSGSGQTQPAWVWRKYSGSNGHTKHLHLSVKGDARHSDSIAPWDLDFPDNKDVDEVARVTDPDPAEEEPSKASETQLEKKTEDTKVTVTEKNEQSVAETHVQEGPKPFNDVGLGQTLKGDLKTVLPANGIVQTATEVAPHVSNVPEWLVPLLIKLAYLVAIGTAIWFLYRLITWGVHVWRENQRVKLEAQINTDTKRKDIKVVPFGTVQHASPDKEEGQS